MIILDDCSRFVVGWGHFYTKESLNTKEVLKHGLQRHGPIAFFFTDNGTEFKGDLRDEIKKRNIWRLFTYPGNPEQNGKVERFWPLFEKTCKRLDQIERFIERYNKMVHMGLESVKSHYPTPIEVYRSIPHWKPDQKAMWIVDGVLKEIPIHCY